MNKKVIGFTTTIPVEVIFASEYRPCDLNNVFITDSNPLRYIERAERDGFPKSMCNWVKGIYGVVMESQIDTVISVIEGDCSNALALLEILRYKGIRVIPFAYPYDRDRKILKKEIRKLMDELSVDVGRLAEVEKEIKLVRTNLGLIDRMTWHDKVVTGHENHIWLVCASDMLGDYKNYKSMTEEFIKGVRSRKKIKGLNIGYIGVPPILLDLYEFCESIGAHVVYNETQRQYAFPQSSKNIVKRYLDYTYPYGIFHRLEDIKKEIERRSIKGLVHYVQAFCHRVLDDVILRDVLDIPVITIEGDIPKKIDARTKLRLEAFIEMLESR
ncbi:MAG: 2-hydroxyglutaryl-CoA dehydratase, D-component [Deltaproteobacteria bacterium ADurb.Bin026]|nr:MAG: 2-hydroxyglutaryl-CoA dehydratase, D-component [Deltaproteobacteria bacterium ADurb.Bin026]